MKKTKPKPDGHVCVMSPIGMSEEHAELFKYFDSWEEIVKWYAKKHDLDIRVSVQLWRIK